MRPREFFAIALAASMLSAAVAIVAILVHLLSIGEKMSSIVDDMESIRAHLTALEKKECPDRKASKDWEEMVAKVAEDAGVLGGNWAPLLPYGSKIRIGSEVNFRQAMKLTDEELGVVGVEILARRAEVLESEMRRQAEAVRVAATDLLRVAATDLRKITAELASVRRNLHILRSKE